MHVGIANFQVLLLIVGGYCLFSDVGQQQWGAPIPSSQLVMWQTSVASVLKPFQKLLSGHSKQNAPSEASINSLFVSCFLNFLIRKSFKRRIFHQDIQRTTPHQQPSLMKLFGSLSKHLPYSALVYIIYFCSS